MNFKYYALWIISQFFFKLMKSYFLFGLFFRKSRGSAKRHAGFDCIFDLPGPLARVKRSPKLVGCSPSPPPRMSTSVGLGTWRASLTYATFPPLPESQYFLQDESQSLILHLVFTFLIVLAIFYSSPSKIWFCSLIYLGCTRTVCG